MSIKPAAAPSFQDDLLSLIPHLRAFARLLCAGRDLADDLVQQTLVKAWAARARFELGTNMKAWLFTILRHEFYSLVRRSWRQAPWDADQAERIPAIADESWSCELNDAAHVLHSLPDQQREAIILIAAGGYSYEEASKICAAPIGTMKSRVARGRAALADALEGTTPLERHPLNGTPSEDILAQLVALTRAGVHRAAFV